MEQLYKLTDADGYTRRGEINETKWEPGVTVTAKGSGGLCTNGVIHAYRDPMLAVLLNPAHGAYDKPLLWEADGEIVVDEKADKIGVKKLTVIKLVMPPTFTTEHKVRFAIGCALLVYQNNNFRNWAQKWLDGSNRYYAAARAADDAAADAAACAARAAAYAARAAAYAACAANAAANAAARAAAYAARAAAYAARAADDAAAYVARAAADAAAYVARAAADISWQILKQIAEWSLTTDGIDALPKL